MRETDMLKCFNLSLLHHDKNGDKEFADLRHLQKEQRKTKFKRKDFQVNPFICANCRGSGACFQIFLHLP